MFLPKTYGFKGTQDFLYSSSSEYIQPINIGITPSRNDTYKNFTHSKVKILLLQIEVSSIQRTLKSFEATWKLQTKTRFFMYLLDLNFLIIKYLIFMIHHWQVYYFGIMNQMVLTIFNLAN